jgi:hypothetical protein
VPEPLPEPTGGAPLASLAELQPVLATPKARRATLAVVPSVLQILPAFLMVVTPFASGFIKPRGD